LIYNEIYSYFLQREQDDPPVVIFFELMDFVLMSSKKKDMNKTEKGWHRIAWAFLKLVSPTGEPNTDKKARLQFFKPLLRMRLQAVDMAGTEIYQWWKTGSRVHYPSTLTVTVKGVYPPEDLNPSLRSMYPTQIERGAKTFDELNNTSSEVKLSTSNHDTAVPLWTKMPGQVNRIPNELKLSLPTDRRGCSAVKFSNDGRYVACACSTINGYPIKIYEFPGGELVCLLNSHFGIIYDLCWSTNNKELLSASADGTVRCWDTKRFNTSYIKLFPHPTFVYVARYHPVHTALVVTGCYDKFIRIWNKLSDTEHATLLRELGGHNGYINTLTFMGSGSMFFSGDSCGIILQWNCHDEKKKKKTSMVDSVNHWKVERMIELLEIKNTAISTLLVHPGQLKVLIHTKDSMLRMLDLRSYGILKTYVGGFNSKEHMHASFSTCGSFIFCGTENGLVNVWNTETGDNVYTYTDLGYLRPVTDIHFHKQDNFIVFCCYGDGGQPVCIYQYNPQVHLDETWNTGDLKEKSARLIETHQSLNDATNMFETFRETSKTRNVTNDDRIQQIQDKLQAVFPSDHENARNKAADTIKRRTLKTPTLKLQTQATMMSTWGSDFARTNAPSITIGPPSSPHANQHLGASGRFQAGSPPSYSRSGSIDMYLDDSKPMSTSQLESPGQKPVFTFNKSIVQRTKPQMEKIVRAIYEYKPNRADELHFYPNDQIKVLYEDNSDWWMGQLHDGQQGYFPASYVHDPSAGDMASVRAPVPTESSGHHSAVIDKHGDIKFLSTNENQTDDINRRKKKKKKKKPTSNEETVC